MNKFLRRATLPILSLLVPALAATAQSIPADTGATPPGIGFSLPRIGGTLTYGLTGSELFSNGFFNNSGVDFTTNISGDVAYVSKSQFHPFSAVYNGGILIANSNQPTTFYQGLSFSQVLSTKNWNIVLADAISYLPQSPVSGLSGIPGVGDVGVDPITVGPNSGIGILTNYGPRVSNTFSGTVSRVLTGRISAQGSGVIGVQRFVGDNSILGLNSTTYGASGGLNYALSARDSVGANYNYSSFTYSGSPYSFESQGASIQYSRQWSGRLTSSFYFGPQVIGGSSAAYSGTSVQFSGGASASYASRFVSYSLSYSRGANNGSGVVPGAFSDNIVLAAHRQFGRDWAISGDLGYSRNRSLPNFNLYTYSGNSVSVSGQATRALGRSFSCFLGYTLERQSNGAETTVFGPQNAFSGFYEVGSVGITYSPRNLLLSK